MTDLSLPDEETQRLLQFLYVCPVGLVSFHDDGTIDRINPAAVNLLVTTASLPDHRNVFDMFRQVWPELGDLVRDYPAREGVIASDRRFRSVPGRAERWLSFGVVRVADDSNMLTASDATAAVIAELRLAESLGTERVARERLEFLERVAGQIAAATTVEEISLSVLTWLKETVGLDGATISLRDRDSLRIVAPPSIDAASIERFQGIGLDARLPGPEAMRRNDTIVVRGVDEIRSAFPALHDTGYVLDGLAAVPLRATNGAALGALVVATPDRADLDDATVSLLRSVAHQTGQAIERAVVFEQLVDLSNREHAIAVRLQHALLPDHFVQHSNVTITARFAAATDLMEVGGDWYDTYSWGDRHVGVVVGDVVGHDIGAATIMGRLRSGVAALAPLLEPRPAAILDSYAHCALSAKNAFATVASVVLDADTGEMTYALAGHPPPLLIKPDGSTAWLYGRPSPPIGTSHVRDHHEETVHLEPGSCLILYSDGLIERRGENLQVGLDRLASAVIGHHEATPDDLADLLIAALTSGRVLGDDVIVVCARWEPLPPNRFAEQLPARLESLTILRDRLHRWLRRNNITGTDEQRLMLSVGEATTNVVEHAYRHRRTIGAIRVEIELVENQAIAQITDTGTWRAPTTPDTGRRRGTVIMTALSDDFDRTSTPEGTTVVLRIPVRAGS